MIIDVLCNRRDFFSGPEFMCQLKKRSKGGVWEGDARSVVKGTPRDAGRSQEEQEGRRRGDSPGRRVNSGLYAQKE